LLLCSTRVRAAKLERAGFHLAHATLASALGQAGW
jgi:hypothetical protein